MGFRETSPQMNANLRRSFLFSFRVFEIQKEAIHELHEGHENEICVHLRLLAV